MGFWTGPTDENSTFNLDLNSLNHCSTYVFYTICFQLLSLFKLLELYLVDTCNSVVDSLLEKNRFYSYVIARFLSIAFVIEWI